jgi:hypothetical protein
VKGETMGVLTDFVVAKREQADQVARSSCASDEFDRIDAKGISEETLADLYAVLSGEEVEAGFMSDALLASRTPQDGPWVFEVPAPLVRLVAALGPKQLADVASEWAETNEVNADFWSLEDLTVCLARIATQCRRAEAKGESLLMWVCL